MSDPPKPLSFSSEGYPGPDRLAAWADAVGKLGFGAKTGSGAADFYGSIVSRTSPRGIAFSRLSSIAQSLRYAPPAHKDSVLVCLHLEGGCRLDGDAGEPIEPHDVIFVPASAAFGMTFTTSFRHLLVRIPIETINLRLQTTIGSGLVRISGHAGLGFLFARLLTAVSETMEVVQSDELRPIEHALSEFLIAMLAKQTPDNPANRAGSQSAILNRICEHVEGRLSDPDLTLADIGREQGISVRYLQKLFETAGESFTHYLRQRRLERCRSDLSNPLFAALSISEVCFKWGYNDAAHFSRTFRERFGMSPRAYRSDALLRPQDAASPAKRGWPSEALETGTRFRAANGSQEQGTRSAPHSADDAATRHYLAATDRTVHWGYFSRALPPVLQIGSGDVVTVEVLTQHAYDDYERMIKGDAGIESVFGWTAEGKNIDRRGAGPMDASVFGRGAGEGFGVHILTGPISVEGAAPGDVLEVRIIDVLPRPSLNGEFAGRCFGSNAAAFWGFHYDDLLTEPRPREVVTLYEFDLGKDRPCACAVYSYRWTPQTDPFGVVHKTIDYPGVPVDHGTVEKRYGILEGVEVPVRPHFGVIGVAPREAGLVDSVPPSYFGGNIDNWRVGKGSKVFLPVSVPGALLSIGDPHASQGDSELCGTAIECSLTGVFQIVLHKKGDLGDKTIADLSYPLIETPTEWVLLGFSHPNYLAELGDKAQSKVYDSGSLDLAMKDAFRKMRRFLMTAHDLTEDEALSLISVAVDFGVSQVVDGNWGVHAILRKELFRGRFPQPVPEDDDV
jgi:acetamidase/formamidase/AraC-like DNA-binding protein